MDITATITGHNSLQVADKINDAFFAGQVTKLFETDEIVSVWGKAPAVAWKNGTVSVTVKGRTKGKVGTRYVKVGKTIRVS